MVLCCSIVLTFCYRRDVQEKGFSLSSLLKRWMTVFFFYWSGAAITRAVGVKPRRPTTTHTHARAHARTRTHTHTCAPSELWWCWVNPQGWTSEFSGLGEWTNEHWRGQLCKWTNSPQSFPNTVYVQRCKQPRPFPGCGGEYSLNAHGKDILNSLSVFSTWIFWWFLFLALCYHWIILMLLLSMILIWFAVLLQSSCHWWRRRGRWGEANTVTAQNSQLRGRRKSAQKFAKRRAFVCGEGISTVFTKQASKKKKMSCT